MEQRAKPAAIEVPLLKAAAPQEQAAKPAAPVAIKAAAIPAVSALKSAALPPTLSPCTSPTVPFPQCELAMLGYCVSANSLVAKQLPVANYDTFKKGAECALQSLKNDSKYTMTAVCMRYGRVAAHVPDNMAYVFEEGYKTVCSFFGYGPLMQELNNPRPNQVASSPSAAPAQLPNVPLQKPSGVTAVTQPVELHSTSVVPAAQPSQPAQKPAASAVPAKPIARPIQNPEAVRVIEFLEAIANGENEKSLSMIKSGISAQYTLSLLHMAAMNGQNEVIELLLNNKATLDEVDHEGNTALHLALRHGYQQTALLLITKSTEEMLNIQNLQQQTPLILAAQKGFMDAVNELLRRNARVDLKDDKDQNYFAYLPAQYKTFWQLHSQARNQPQAQANNQH